MWNTTRMDIVSFMFFLGWIHVIWALIQMGVTNLPIVRRHFAYYFLGVGAYFILLFLLGMLLPMAPENHILFEIHFFGSAFGLAIYHFVIVVMSVWLGFKDPAAVPTPIKSAEE
ncbi:MAG: hypothetical protein RLZZ519_2169 [Bacteroidota bacterium]